MTHLERAIKESKEREDKATPPPWNRAWVNEYPRHVQWSKWDNEFIYQARTWEPKWREMVELCIKTLEYYSEYIGNDERGVQARKTLHKLERLAKEGLGE